jgi:hypothetical protein
MTLSLLSLSRARRGNARPSTPLMTGTDAVIHLPSILST